MHINSWAAYELELINERDSSMLAPLKRAAGDFLGFPVARSERDVKEAFFGLSDSVRQHVDKVLVDALFSRETLGKMKDVLTNIAVITLGDEKKLDKQKLNQKSYWKWILRSYRDQMSDFDSRMEICASFYRHTEQAFDVVSTTQFKMQQMRAQLKLFGEALQDQPLAIGGGAKGTLQLYIKMLNSGVESLEATRKSTTGIEAQKMKEIEASLKHKL